jgi:hypothetical protein
VTLFFLAFGLFIASVFGAFLTSYLNDYSFLFTGTEGTKFVFVLKCPRFSKKTVVSGTRFLLVASGSRNLSRKGFIQEDLTD